MPDILDEIIDRLSPSTLELILQYGCDSSRDGNKLSHLLSETQRTRIRQITRELHRKCLNVKLRSTENLQIAVKLCNDLKAQKSLESSYDHQQNIVVLTKQLRTYNAKIKEITVSTGPTNAIELFKNIESLHDEIEKIRVKVIEARNKYKSLDGIPPNIEGAKKAVEDIKEQIKIEEQKIDSLF